MPSVLTFLKKSFVEKNPTIKQILVQTDCGTRDNRYNKEEISCFLEQSIGSLGNLFNNRLVNQVFDWMDVGATQDGYISNLEINNFLQNEYGLNLSEIENMTLTEFCSVLDAIS